MSPQPLEGLGVVALECPLRPGIVHIQRPVLVRQERGPTLTHRQLGMAISYVIIQKHGQHHQIRPISGSLLLEEKEFLKGSVTVQPEIEDLASAPIYPELFLQKIGKRLIKVYLGPFR